MAGAIMNHSLKIYKKQIDKTLKSDGLTTAQKSRIILGILEAEIIAKEYFIKERNQLLKKAK